MGRAGFVEARGVVMTHPILTAMPLNTRGYQATCSGTGHTASATWSEKAPTCPIFRNALGRHTTGACHSATGKLSHVHMGRACAATLVS